MKRTEKWMFAQFRITRLEFMTKLLVMMVWGGIAGILLKDGVETLLARQGLPGGEVLIIPLIALCILLGYFYRRDFFEEVDRLEEYLKGYHDGISDGYDGAVARMKIEKMDEVKDEHHKTCEKEIS